MGHNGSQQARAAHLTTAGNIKLGQFTVMLVRSCPEFYQAVVADGALLWSTDTRTILSSLVSIAPSSIALAM